MLECPRTAALGDWSEFCVGNVTFGLKGRSSIHGSARTRLHVRMLSWAEIDGLVDGLASRLPPGSRCWGVPRGGSVVAAMLRSKHGVSITADSSDATIAVDDLIDSGRTAKMVKDKYNLDLEPLLVKENSDWIVFPWEGTELTEDAENTVTRMLQQIGEDPNRPELEDTPRRVVQCWDDLFSGYRYSGTEVAQLLDRDVAASATPPGRCVDGMFVVSGVPFISTCENHLLPFHGTADVACLPAAVSNGLGGIPRLVDAFARRLQTQQRLTEQICHALAASSEGAAVRLTGNSICSMARRLESRQSVVETVSFSGGFRTDPGLQDRFLGQFQ